MQYRKWRGAFNWNPFMRLSDSRRQKIPVARFGSIMRVTEAEQFGFRHSRPGWKTSKKHIQETRISRHHGSPISSPLSYWWVVLRPFNTIVLRGLRDAHNWTLIMPRDASLPDSYTSQPVLTWPEHLVIIWPDRPMITLSSADWEALQRLLPRDRRFSA